MIDLPYISCLCPTYKRPELLKNAMACYLAQEYPKHRCELVIFDDADQIYDQCSYDGPGCAEKIWNVYSTAYRYRTLPEKFNKIAAGFAYVEADIFCVWEDDDFFFPDHLQNIATAFQQNGPGYYIPQTVYSNYGKPFGELQIEDATGRFHSSWAYRVDIFRKIGGYPETGRLDFDQQMRDRMKDAAGGFSYYGIASRPSYCYRWGNGIYHGSQAGEEGYQELWDRLGRLPAPPVGKLVPQLDDWGKAIMAKYWEGTAAA